MNRKYSSGTITLKSANSNDIKAFGLERTVCDILRRRNQADGQLVNEVLKKYVKRREKDLDLLFQYAGQFRIQKIVRDTIEFLL